MVAYVMVVVLGIRVAASKTVSVGVYASHTSTCAVLAALDVKVPTVVPSPAAVVALTESVPVAVTRIWQSIEVADTYFVESTVAPTPKLMVVVLALVTAVPVKLVPVISTHMVSPMLPAAGLTAVTVGRASIEYNEELVAVSAVVLTDNI
jgi:hypothetical protein